MRCFGTMRRLIFSQVISVSSATSQVGIANPVIVDQGVCDFSSYSQMTFVLFSEVEGELLRLDWMSVR